MKFTFYELYPGTADLRPNTATRQWMDDTTDSFAYRCLPLNIANAHGWSFHLPFPFFVHWDGRNTKDAIRFRHADGVNIGSVAASAFGHGILTFFVPGIFRTPEGWDMIAGGPVNMPKDGIAPLQGIIETDWAPYSFTMNWKITRPNTWIGFEEGEPFCSVHPVKHGHLQEMEPEIAPLSSNPDLQKAHDEWSASRNKFVKDLDVPGSEATKQKWQKNYYRGHHLDGSKGHEEHLIKLRLKPFAQSTADSDTKADAKPRGKMKLELDLDPDSDTKSDS